MSVFSHFHFFLFPFPVSQSFLSFPPFLSLISYSGPLSPNSHLSLFVSLIFQVGHTAMRIITTSVCHTYIILHLFFCSTSPPSSLVSICHLVFLLFLSFSVSFSFFITKLACGITICHILSCCFSRDLACSSTNSLASFQKNYSLLFRSIRSFLVYLSSSILFRIMYLIDYD